MGYSTVFSPKSGVFSFFTNFFDRATGRSPVDSGEMTSEQIKQLVHQAGAAAVGVARTDTDGLVDTACTEQFRLWLQLGRNASMHWLENHSLLRMAPSRLLDGPDAPPRQVSIIVAAFGYMQPVSRSPHLPRIARFAWGEDYHKVLRRRLKPVCRAIAENTSARTRICIDSAPIHERFWAMKAGVGRQGLSGLLIVPKLGTYNLLAEIITDLPLQPDTPLSPGCNECGRCLRACPGGAISGDRSIDASRCRSFLTIEADCPGSTHSLPDNAGNRYIFGCDICQNVCPHNHDVDTSLTLPEFIPSHDMLCLDDEALASMSEEIFARKFGHTPLKRAGLTKLIANCRPKTYRAKF